VSSVGHGSSIQQGSSLTRPAPWRERLSPTRRSPGATAASRERKLVAAVQRLSQARSLEEIQRIVLSTARRLTGAEVVRITKALEDSRLETLRHLALATEYHDDGNHQHTERVACTSRAIAAQLGLPERQRELIYKAAPLHDVGKLAIPEALLLKPGRLTRAEFEQVKRHTTTGADILAGSPSAVIRVAEEIARTHHEWWDGSGYPAGLAGEDIPVSGRIVALADVFDALTHQRPYKPAWTVEASVAEIHRLIGRQFDPQIVDAFITLDPSEFVDLPDDRRLCAGPSDSAAPNVLGDLELAQRLARAYRG